MTARTPSPRLVARYDALGKLPQNTFGKALWDFDKRNGYPFPGDPTALNAAFGTAHDSTHVISGYDTSARGELLVSTFTAGMHPINPMSGHILPVIFFFHFGEQLNDVGHAGTGGLDPDEFWHAWARGAEMAVDIFDPQWNVWDWVETRPRGPAARVERHAGRHGRPDDQPPIPVLVLPDAVILRAMTPDDFFRRIEAHRPTSWRARVCADWACTGPWRVARRPGQRRRRSRRIRPDPRPFRACRAQGTSC